MKDFTAIIFDLGNVIIDIDYHVLESEFRKIALFDFREIISYSHQENFFDQFEKGRISAATFRDTLRKYLKPGTTDQEIDRAWNSIMTHYPPAKFDLLKKLRSKYKVYALSNINEIHSASIDAHIQKAFGMPDMKSYFDHAYYSYEMDHRKPESEIYQIVVMHQGLDPAQTLFIDDKSENTDAAAALGFQVHHLTDRESLIGLFGG